MPACLLLCVGVVNHGEILLGSAQAVADKSVHVNIGWRKVAAATILYFVIGKQTENMFYSNSTLFI